MVWLAPGSQQHVSYLSATCQLPIKQQVRHYLPASCGSVREPSNSGRASAKSWRDWGSATRRRERVSGTGMVQERARDPRRQRAAASWPASATWSSPSCAWTGNEHRRPPALPCLAARLAPPGGHELLAGFAGVLVPAPAIAFELAPEPERSKDPRPARFRGDHAVLPGG